MGYQKLILREILEEQKVPKSDPRETHSSSYLWRSQGRILLGGNAYTSLNADQIITWTSRGFLDRARNMFSFFFFLSLEVILSTSGVPHFWQRIRKISKCRAQSPDSRHWNVFLCPGEKKGFILQGCPTSGTLWVVYVGHSCDSV